MGHNPSNYRYITYKPVRDIGVINAPTFHAIFERPGAKIGSQRSIFDRPMWSPKIHEIAWKVGAFITPMSRTGL